MTLFWISMKCHYLTYHTLESSLLEKTTNVSHQYNFPALGATDYLSAARKDVVNILMNCMSEKDKRFL